MARTWAEAMAADLHGPAGRHSPAGFYRRGRGPGVDFRTAATVAPDLLADAIVVLFEALPMRARREVVEVGAGDGSLLTALAERLPQEVRLVAVEQRPRPTRLPDRVRWQEELPDSVTGLLLAFEWLDTLPVDVVEEDRLIAVGPDGTEHEGARPSERDTEWLDRWWPAGPRREVGYRRDQAWADAVSRLQTGLAIAVDYGHTRENRPAQGSLTAYRAGRRVRPLPEPDTDVTAAVAWDAILAAVEPHVGVLLPQATALSRLGVSAQLPSRAATTAATLARANRARQLLDPAGLGGFGWAVTAVDVELPAALSVGRGS